MTIEKLKSGNYRITQMIDGKRYRKTIDHKPTQIEAMKIITSMTEKEIVSRSFLAMCETYIASKSNILSPSTIRNYRSIIRNMPDELKRSKSVDLPLIQRVINEYSINHSPKSVRNMSGFIISVCKFYGMDIKSPKLPQKEVKKDYIPSENDIRAIFREVKGSKYEVPFMLSVMGLRRSEVCALNDESLQGNVLTIDKAKVQNENNEWVIKKTKTESSTRTIILPDYLVELINEKGFYENDPHSLYNALTRIQKKLGIPHFSLHKMRHFCMSYLHDLGYSDKQIQEIGGYRSNTVLNQVYKHAMNMPEVKEKVSNDFSRIFDT